MSCHTWAYKKILDKDLDKFKADICAKIQSSIYYIKDEKDNEEKVRKFTNMVKKYHEQDKDDEHYRRLANDANTARNYILKRSEYLHELENKVNNAATCSDIWWNVIEESEYLFGVDYEMYNGDVYQYIAFDQPCRISEYNEMYFTNPHTFIKWVKLQEAELKAPISFLDYENGMTEKMEEEIIKFFNEHDDNILLRFG